MLGVTPDLMCRVLPQTSCAAMPGVTPDLMCSHAGCHPRPHVIHNTNQLVQTVNHSLIDFAGYISQLGPSTVISFCGEAIWDKLIMYIAIRAPEVPGVVPNMESLP